jgi:hypothetical protein
MQAICECADAHLILPNASPPCGKNNHAATLSDITLAQVFHRGRELTTVLASEKSLEMLANLDSPS